VFGAQEALPGGYHNDGIVGTADHVGTWRM
jgi:hypothetical protein